MDAASRLRQIYKHSAGLDSFLRTGFRVAGATTRNRLNQIANDILDGMDTAHRIGPVALGSAPVLEPRRVAAHLFGVAAGSILQGARTKPRQSPQWNFLLALGRGFASGHLREQEEQSNAVLTGRGLFLAYWHWRQYVEEQSRDPAHPAIDRGLGAMIWLGSGADAVTAASLAHSFLRERRTEIWRGLGFALSFLSDLHESRFGAAGTILQAAGPMASSLIDGVAFGAFQRQQIRDIDQPLEHVCRQVAGESAANLVQTSRNRFADWE